MGLDRFERLCRWMVDGEEIGWGSYAFDLAALCHLVLIRGSHPAPLGLGLVPGQGQARGSPPNGSRVSRETVAIHLARRLPRHE